MKIRPALTGAFLGFSLVVFARGARAEVSYDPTLNENVGAVPAIPTPLAPDASGVSSVTSSSLEAADEEEEDSESRAVSVDYFAYFYGPALQGSAIYQPTSDGTSDASKPVELQNRLGVSIPVTEKISVSPTLYWTMRPIRGQTIQLQDPYLRVSYYPVVDTGNLTLYSDARLHFPVSQDSRAANLFLGLQTFHVLAYNPWGPLTVGANGSARYNLYGSRGYGSDFDLYLAPNASLTVSPKLAVTVLYEMEATHYFGDPAFHFVNQGADIQPGLRWDVTKSLAVNPYLIMYPGTISLRSTSIGANIFWSVL